MAAIPFLDPENEDRDTRQIAFWSCVAITIGLAATSIFGVWVVEGAFWGKIWRSAYILGAEFLAMGALVRSIMAFQSKRWIAGGLGMAVFVGLAWFCVHNVEEGTHQAFPTMFASDGIELREKAKLAEEEAGRMDTGAVSREERDAEYIASVRKELADAKADQQLMASMSKPKIMEAQKKLQTLGKYSGNIDGLDEELTRDARLAYGEELKARVTQLQGVIDNYSMGASVAAAAGVVVATAEDKRIARIELEGDAREREKRGRLLVTGLWTLEGARSLGLWVFVSSGVGAASSRRKDENEKEEAPPEVKAAPEPEAVPETEPAPVVVEAPQPKPPTPEPEPPIAELEAPVADFNEAKINKARKGGRAAAAARRAERNEIVIEVGDWRARDGITEEAA